MPTTMDRGGRKCSASKPKEEKGEKKRKTIAW